MTIACPGAQAAIATRISDTDSIQPNPIAICWDPAVRVAALLLVSVLVGDGGPPDVVDSLPFGGAPPAVVVGVTAGST